MYGRGSAFIIGGILVWFGWRMLVDNWNSLKNREAMFDEYTRTTSNIYGTVLIIVGALMVLLGLAILSGMIWWYFYRH